MAVSEIDLNINNYNLDEILCLFDLNADFDDVGLKRAYKQALMTHPDKSGLDKEYFLFFSRAFKKVKYIFDFKNKTDKNRKDYVDDYKILMECEYENHNNISVEQMIKINSKENSKDKSFNVRFNELFEKVKIYDEEQDSGYDEWIEVNNGQICDNNENITNIRSLNEYIDRKRHEIKSLIKYDGIQDINSSDMMGNNSNLKREKPEYYESGLFSKMQYDDYKRAHTETVIPVTEEDFNNRKHFNSVNEMRNYRKNNEGTLSLEQSEEILRQRKKQENDESMSIAYNLTKQMEQIKDSRRIFAANFNLLLDE
jgi:hypothetical protein